ncbi:MAG TPA: RNase adapter RapZ [Candidatus Dormibacteraeota bacterium]|nr:RNase adapter RapZ [Candidatus Dormibacteraeota bacterium]
MSLVVILSEERFREALEALAIGVGYSVPRPAELAGDPDAAVRAQLERHPDLALVVTERLGQDWSGALDRAGTRYWLVEAGSPEGAGFVPPTRRPHRHLLGLDHSTVGYLRQLLDDWRDRDLLRVDCFTFAFRDGVPHEADWVIDTRFLDSPYWIEEMRERPGTDPLVRNYVMAQPGAEELIGQFLPMLLRLVPLYQAQRRSVLRIAVGCTGGRHRSMAIASELVERVGESQVATARYLKEPPVHLPQELD